MKFESYETVCSRSSGPSSSNQPVAHYQQSYVIFIFERTERNEPKMPVTYLVQSGDLIIMKHLGALTKEWVFLPPYSYLEGTTHSSGKVTGKKRVALVSQFRSLHTFP